MTYSQRFWFINFNRHITKGIKYLHICGQTWQMIRAQPSGRKIDKECIALFITRTLKQWCQPTSTQAILIGRTNHQITQKHLTSNSLPFVLVITIVPSTHASNWSSDFLNNKPIESMTRSNVSFRVSEPILWAFQILAVPPSMSSLTKEIFRRKCSLILVWGEVVVTNTC